jgi:hypothetical protein
MEIYVRKHASSAWQDQALDRKVSSNGALPLQVDDQNELR